MQTLENAVPKAQRAARGGDKEAKLRLDAIEKCNAHLESEQPLRTLKLSEAEAKAISSFGLMTAKPILYVANVSETDLEGKDPLVEKVRQHAEKSGAGVVCVSVKLEAEIAELDPDDRDEMLADVGFE